MSPYNVHHHCCYSYSTVVVFCLLLQIARNTPKVSHETMKRARVDAESAAAVKKLRSSRVRSISCIAG